MTGTKPSHRGILRAGVVRLWKDNEVLDSEDDERFSAALSIISCVLRLASAVRNIGRVP